MKQIFKTEMKRAMRGNGMALSILIGILIGTAHVIQEIIPAYRANLTNFYNEFPILSPHSAVETWMAGSPSNLEGFIFFLILPILASLPFGTSYFEDCKEGVIKNIYMRTKREDYLKAKYAAAFLSGGIAVLVPLIFNLMCSLVLLPNLAPLSTMGDNILTPLMLFYKIFFTHPMIYTTFFLVLQFLMAGIWAYHLSASTIDYVIAQQGALYSGLTIFPFVLFFVIKCKQDSLNIQYILRYQSRKRMFQQQLKESLVYAAGISFIIILMATFTGWIFSRNLINWDTMESVYFGQTGNVVKSHFLSVAVVIWLMYVLKLILLFVMVDIFLWYPKTLFFIWIVLLVPLGIEAFHHGKIYFSLFAVWQTSWNTPGKWLGIILIGIVVLFIEKLIGEKMIERRDIWR